MAAAAIFDLRSRRIPNPLALAIAAAGLVHAVGAGGPRGALASLFGAGAGVMLLMGPFAKGLVGGGDVKLLGAVGAWTGAVAAVRILVLGAAAGGFLALAYFLHSSADERIRVRRGLTGFARSGELAVPPPDELARAERARGIPYGLALTAAALWVLLSGTR